MAAPRFLANIAGRIKMLATIVTSAGAADAEKVPSTNASGYLDPSLLNAATSGNSKVLLTKADGTIDPAVLPSGLGVQTKNVLASEALAAGALVNIWPNAGTENVRNADATAEGKEAHGFVKAAVASGATASVYLEGTITGLSGLTPGTRMYLATSAGAATATSPNAAGNVSQHIGDALSATEIDFEKAEPITVA